MATKLMVAPEHVNPAGRHLPLDEPPVHYPEDAGREARKEWVRPPPAGADDEVDLAAFHGLEKVEDKGHRLLQIGGHHRVVRPCGGIESGADGREGAEVSGEKNQARAEARG